MTYCKVILHMSGIKEFIMIILHWKQVLSCNNKFYETCSRTRVLCWYIFVLLSFIPDSKIWNILKLLLASKPFIFNYISTICYFVHCHFFQEWPFNSSFHNTLPNSNRNTSRSYFCKLTYSTWNITMVTSSKVNLHRCWIT